LEESGKLFREGGIGDEDSGASEDIHRDPLL
jgi:hypothetical protein